MFFQPDLVKVNNYLILPKLWYPLNHTSLTVDIFISKEFIYEKQRTIIKNSQKKEIFIFKLTNTLENIDITDLTSIELLKNIVQEYARISSSIVATTSQRPIAIQAINLKVDIKWESQENLTRSPCYIPILFI